MENQSVFDPKMRSEGASSDPAYLARLPYSNGLKKAVRSVEQDISQLCSAFLAERGCLSPGNSQKQTAA
jgi:hypothetical protein